MGIIFLLSMGFLSDGHALEWPDAQQQADYIRKEGIQQFLHAYRRSVGRKNDPLKWGDEIEYLVLALDREKHTARLSLRSPELLNQFAADARESTSPATRWIPEYGSFMLESTPGSPFLIRRANYCVCKPTWSC